MDDFGVKYVNDDDFRHLLAALRELYKISVDLKGERYVGLTLRWDYTLRKLEISIPGYITALLLRLGHPEPAAPQHAPSACPPPLYGKADLVGPPPATSELTDDEHHFIERVTGALLYYARCVDMTMLVAINAIATARKHGRRKTLDATVQLLNYAATHPNATVVYHASDMVLHIHSDASYLSESEARSRIGGFFFLSDRPIDGTKPPSEHPNVMPRLNGAIAAECKLLRHVVSSASEA